MLTIFLDFDGVLHRESDFWHEFCRLPALEQTLERAGLDQLEIILSTTWRHRLPLAELLEPFSKQLKARIAGVTPSTPANTEYQRWEECHKWLNDNHRSGPWLAIDDTAMEFPAGCANLFHVTGDNGISDGELVRLEETIARLIQTT
ncbi:HAD domain-containing protein (plasmid) [Acidithiobacillus ferriphilus]|uniref:HAD domain-containing protein n=1 Tax=Acidithiobacillus TaxID=119977 RepID=UPI0034E411C3